MLLVSERGGREGYYIFFFKGRKFLGFVWLVKVERRILNEDRRIG